MGEEVVMAGKYRSGGFWSNALICTGIGGLALSFGTLLKSCQYSGYTPQYIDTKKEEIALQASIAQVEAEYQRTFGTAIQEIKRRTQNKEYVPINCNGVSLNTESLTQEQVSGHANCLNELGLASAQDTITDLTWLVQNKREPQDYRGLVTNSQNAVQGAKDESLGVAGEGVSWLGIGLLSASVVSLVGGFLGRFR